MALACQLHGLPTLIQRVLGRHEHVELAWLARRLQDDRVWEHAAGQDGLLGQAEDLEEQGLDLKKSDVMHAQHALDPVVLVGPRGLDQPALEGPLFHLRDVLIRERSLVVPALERPVQEAVVFGLERVRVWLQRADVGGHDDALPGQLASPGTRRFEAFFLHFRGPTRI